MEQLDELSLHYGWSVREKQRITELVNQEKRIAAIGFAGWVDNNYWFQHYDTRLWWNSADSELPENITTDQLYELYLQSLNK